MNADYTTVTALNILDGMNHRKHWDMLQPAWEFESMGFLEFCLWIAAIAEESTRILEVRDPQDFPGVYDYEVSYVLGAEIAKHVELHGSLPDEKTWKYLLNTLVENFFEQGAGK
jgi:hypothetical protein